MDILVNCSTSGGCRPLRALLAGGGLLGGRVFVIAKMIRK